MKRRELRSGDEVLDPHTVLCVGRNYAEHARELGNQVPPAPVFFFKPPSSLLPGGGTVEIPSGVGRVDHEVELGVVVGSTMRSASPSEAMEHVLGYCVFVDITARDIQSRAKKRGWPWAVAKGLDTFAPVSDVAPAEEVSLEEGLRLRLSVNGEVRQDGNTSDMLFGVPELLSVASHLFTLERGDIVATGTPSGVGPLVDGDRVVAEIEGVGRVDFVCEAVENRVLERFCRKQFLL